MTKTYYKTLNPTRITPLFRKNSEDLYTLKTENLKKSPGSTMITEVYTDLDLRTIPEFPTLIFMGLQKLHSQFIGSYTENAAVKQHLY